MPAPQWAEVARIRNEMEALNRQIAVLMSQRSDLAHLLEATYEDIAQWHRDRMGGVVDEAESRRGQCQMASHVA